MHRRHLRGDYRNLLPGALLRPCGSQGGNRSEDCLLARSDVGLVAADPNIPEVARVAVALLPARWKLGIARVQAVLGLGQHLVLRRLLWSQWSQCRTKRCVHTYMVDASSRSDG